MHGLDLEQLLVQLVILSLYWKGISENGAFAGMISGGIVIIIWKNLSGGIFDLYEIIPGFILSVLGNSYF